MGVTTARAMRHAPCPVLVVPRSSPWSRQADVVRRRLPAEEIMEPGGTGDRSDAEEPGESLMYEGLTRREVEVIRELLAGRSNKEIGRVLGIREQTVKNTISRILTKLDLQDRLQVALYA